MKSGSLKHGKGKVFNKKKQKKFTYNFHLIMLLLF